MRLATTARLTATGNGIGLVSRSGSIADLDAAPATLVYRGALNSSGAETLSVYASDGSLGPTAAWRSPSSRRPSCRPTCRRRGPP